MLPQATRCGGPNSSSIAPMIILSFSPQLLLLSRYSIARTLPEDASLLRHRWCPSTEGQPSL